MNRLFPIALLLAACSPVSKQLEQPEGMVWVPGGEFVMGTDEPGATAAEYPPHQVRVDGFWMDKTEVTNKQFAEFVEATGYITTAEHAVDWEELKLQLPPNTPKPADSLLLPGSLVFTPPATPVLNYADYSQWWSWVTGASWRHPTGPESSIDGKDNYPVVQVSYEDAIAYCEWAGKRLPTEAEWEIAARGGSAHDFSFDEDLVDDGEFRANFFQGAFPNKNTNEDGFTDAAPVATFSPNGYGLHDMIGNVWEWCADWYSFDIYQSRNALVVNPEGPTKSYDPAEPFGKKRVIRGGSFLCSEQYCSSYRPTARMAASFDTGQQHVGFRCVKDKD